MPLNITDQQRAATTTGGLLRFPEDLGAPPYEKWIMFEVKAGRHITRTGIVGAANNADRTIKTVALYLPPSALASELSVDWKEDEYGAIVGAALQTAVQEKMGPLGKAATLSNDLRAELPNLANAAGAGATAAAKAFAADLAQNFASIITFGTVGQTQVSGLLGATPNPRTDQFFDSVKYRDHSFDFVMVPRNKREADAIDQILNTFQFYMLPTFGNAAGDNAVFIGYPYEFEISMFTEFTGGHHINTIDRSVLTSITINHASANRVAFVDEGTNRTEYYPASTTMTLNFKEVRLQGRNMQRVIWRGSGNGQGKPVDPGRVAYPDDSWYSQ